MLCVRAESRAEVWVTVSMSEVKAAASGRGVEPGCVFLARCRALHGVTARKTMLCEWFLSVLALLWLGSPRGCISLPIDRQRL